MSKILLMSALVGVVSLSCGAAPEMPVPGHTRRALSWKIFFPISDTGYETTPVKTHVDRGRSCELRTNNIASEAQPFYIALKFEFAINLCSSLERAVLRMRTTQAGQTGLVVHPRNITSSWKAGDTGLGDCDACFVSSGSPQTNPLPSFDAPLAGQAITESCTWYEWDVTNIVHAWCAQGGAYPSLMLTGLSGSGVATFHSVEAPNGNRPQLTVYHL